MDYFTFFHKPNEENGFLSNWYPCKFNVTGVTYTSMEQYMMHHKAILFHDYTTAKKILATTDVAKIKALGREVRNFSEVTWKANRERIVYNGLYAKFTQNGGLHDGLLSTGNTILAECAVKDKVWGIGMSMKDPNRFYPEKWEGMNLLGELLMQVRTKLFTEMGK